jgi:protein-S-isoprenylcysteine O-methyltransferase Ste14
VKPGALAVTVVPWVALGFLVLKFASTPWSLLRLLGLIIMIGGFIAATVARVQLGNSFTVRPEARALVTRGIYSKIRNPIYIFSAIAIAGLFLFLGRPVLLWLFLVLIPLQAVRARKEARVLEEHFGEAYRRYKALTWF